MRPEVFRLERYFALHEFSAPWLLSSSDCESTTVDELLALEPTAREKLGALRLGYTESAGSPTLRREIASLYPGLNEDDVLVHCGAEEAILTFAMAGLEAGDRVVVQTPCYQSLEELARARGCEVVAWEGRPERGWRPELSDLRRLAGTRCSVIVTNSPHNPTGFQWTKDELLQLSALAHELGARLFCDEVYRFMEHGTAEPLPAACTLGPRAVSLGVMSKSLGLAGLRIGWVATKDRSLLAAMAAAKDYTTICSPGPSELLAEVALRNRTRVLDRTRGLTLGNLKLLTRFMETRSDRLEWAPPTAGPVAFPAVKGSEDAAPFCEHALKEAGVLLLPGGLFGPAWKRHFRLGYGRATFPEALQRLDRWMGK